MRTSKTCNNFGRLFAAERKWMSKTIALPSYLINLMSVQLMNILCLNLESGLWLSLAHILRFISPMFPSRLRVFFIAGPIRSSVVICGEKASPWQRRHSRVSRRESEHHQLATEALLGMRLLIEGQANVWSDATQHRMFEWGRDNHWTRWGRSGRYGITKITPRILCIWT